MRPFSLTLRLLWLRLRQILFPASSSYYIGGAETLPPALTPDEEATLLGDFRPGGASGRRTLIEHNLRLVVYIARKFENTGSDLEDLISIGTIGLIKAINTYDPDRKIKLATYASRCIENEILMHLRRTSNLRREVSLSEPLGHDSDGNELLLADILGTDPEEVTKPFEDDVDLSLLRSALSRLTPRERMIISLRFGIGGTPGRSAGEKTQKEVADLLGISQSYISRLEKRIIVRLRRELFRSF